MKRTIALFTITSLAFVTTSASAATFKASESVKISDDLSDDLYSAGSDVTLQSEVDGDVVLVGSEVFMSGDVEEDLTLAGGKVVVSGTTKDDVKIAAGEARFAGFAGDDLFVAAGEVYIEDSAIIEGDLRIAGGDIFINGTVKGDLYVRAGKVILNGTVEGNADVSTSNFTINGNVEGESTVVSDEITLGEQAEFDSPVTYWKEGGALQIPTRLEDVEFIYDESIEPFRAEEYEREESVAAKISKLFISLLFGSTIILVFALLTKTFFTDSAKKLKKSFWLSTLYGFLYFIATPIAALLLMITFVGIPFSLLFFFAYAFSIYFAKPITAMVFAKYLEAKYKKKWSFWPYVGVSILCLLGLKIIGMAPVVGWLVVASLIFAAYGAVIQAKGEKWQKIR